MRNVARELWRVLKDDGTFWLNLGDCYATTRPGSGGVCVLRGAGRAMREARYTDIVRDVSSLKPKDLVGIPWRVAFALQADGWYLRSDIIWHKPNPMPESVTDRPTKAHEYLFLMTKRERYRFDAKAIAEPASDPEYRLRGKIRPVTSIDAHFRSNPVKAATRANLHNMPGGRATRNRRTVWTVTTRPYKDAHFATFPEKLIEPCILAGSRPNDVVLDPFSGAATTGLVALKHGRRYIGIELNPKYQVMARRRLRPVAAVIA